MFSDRFLWEVFSLQCERDPLHLDIHGRFPISEATHPVSVPIVSSRLNELGWKPTYPKGAPYAVVVSHDIDFIYHKDQEIGPRELIISTLKNVLRADLKKIRHEYNRLNTKAVNRWPVEKLMHYFQSKDIPTTYYFMCLDPSDQDYNYDIEMLKPLITQILDAGNEVGLHGGHTAYKSASDFIQQLSRLKKVTELEKVGYRNHYLKFNLDSFEIMREAGISTDSTLGFADIVGFRNGMAHPFRPYNCRENSFYDFVEIPLIMMDQTLYKYMNLSQNDLRKVSNQIIDRVSEVSGTLSLLWHNTTFQGEKVQDLDYMIERMRDDGAWFCTPNELVEWYEKNDLFSTQMEYLQKLR